MGILWFLVGLVVGAGAMYAFHAKVKKALEVTKFELEEKVDKLKKEIKDKIS